MGLHHHHKRHKLLLAMIAGLITLLGVEAISRWWLEGNVIKTIEIQTEKGPIRPDDRFGFVLAPGDYDGTHINRIGLRGPEIEEHKRAECIRILMLGGSTTYGNTVSTEEAYPAVVQHLLRQTNPHRCIEVINAGVSGAYSYHHLVRYQHLYSALRPDIVTMYIGWNDYAGYLWQRGDWKADSLAVNSLIIDVGSIPMALLRRSSAARIAYTSYKRASFRQALSELSSCTDVAAALRPATEGLHHNLARLIELVQRDGAKVLLIKFPYVLRDDQIKQDLELLSTMDVPGRIESMLPMVRFEPSMPTLAASVMDRLAQEKRVGVVDCRTVFYDLSLEERLDRFDDAIHPNAKGYALIGKCVADAIEPWIAVP